MQDCIMASSSSTSSAEPTPESGLLRSALSATLDKYVAATGRSFGLNERTQQILKKINETQTNIHCFEKFSSRVVAFLEEQIGKTSARFKAASAKRSKLWSLFHTMRNDRGGILISSWNQLLQDLGVDVYDPLLMQTVYQEVFESLLRQHFTTKDQISSDSEGEAALTKDELNALRYAAGYVPHSLLKRYEKRGGEKNSQFVVCLAEMAVAGEGDDILSYTRKWFDVVNRGGLYPLNDQSFSLLLKLKKLFKLYPRSTC